jgi:hypothetical protein
VKVTISHNDNCAEMLAATRRGPCATPTEEERIEYLLTRVRKTEKRPAFEKHALEHVLSYQRRVHAIKLNFMTKNAATPLGIVSDWWDRAPALVPGRLTVVLYDF